MQIIENFLEDNSFKDLQHLVLQSEFSWFQRKYMVSLDEARDDLGYFTHSFFNENNINCEHYYKYIRPILNQLKAKAPIQVRANLTPSCFYKKPTSVFHVDYKYKCTTAILYLNNCNGGTEFKIDNKIKFIQAKENTIVIFDSSIEHRGTKSTDQDFRYILNFNYF
tara:strand:+ start:79 stop:576 length:498 start_codon:yes stop_codon:yes gene_type:complete